MTFEKSRHVLLCQMTK